MPLWPPVDETKGSCGSPGIYRISIDGEGVYVGRFTKSGRPLREYSRNVQKLISDLPYRPQDPNGFRYVHLALHRAVRAGGDIRFEIVENCEREQLNERERFWIDQVPVDRRLNGRKRPR